MRRSSPNSAARFNVRRGQELVTRADIVYVAATDGLHCPLPAPLQRLPPYGRSTPEPILYELEADVLAESK